MRGIMQGRDHREHALALHEELISTGKNNLSPAVALLLQLPQISVLASQSSSCRRYGYLPSLTLTTGQLPVVSRSRLSSHA